MIRFKLRTSFITLKTVNILFSIAIFFVFLAAILPFIPGSAIPLISYPVFWEIIAGLFFVIGAFGFFWTINRHAKLSSKNFKPFFYECYSLIEKGNEKDLRELAEEIFNSIEEVINESNKYTRKELNWVKGNNSNFETSEYTKYALSLLDIWSDSKFCEIIVCNVPTTAIELFHQIDEQNFYHSGGYSLVQQIIHKSYYTQSSILHREEDFKGLGHFKSFTKTVFGNYQLIESHFRPFQAWEYLDEDDIKTWQIKKYCETINVSLNAYFYSKGNHFAFPAALFSAYTQLEHIALSEIIIFDKIPELNAYSSPPFKKLSIIQKGLKNAVKLVEKNYSKLPEYELIEENYDVFKDNSIYGIIAHAIYEYFNNIASIHSQDEAVRDLAIILWMDVYPVSKNLESKPIKEIQNRLTIHILNKVEENLLKLYYPAITRLLINLIGLYPVKETKEDYGKITFKKKFIELLCNNFENAFKINSKIALNMIPSNTKYIEKKGQLVQTIRADSEPFILNLRKNTD